MGNVRKPFQGILNIVRFNWHFYMIASVLIFLVVFLLKFTNPLISTVLLVVVAVVSILIIISMAVSFYVYDLSGLYNIEWITESDARISVININAGFDETSSILKTKFTNANFRVLDFYNPNKHTEVSIKRARKIYPPYPGTIKIETSKIDIENNSIDKIFVVLSAHEIRNQKERIVFFKELRRILSDKGQILVIEHLRDVSNFIAYNVGAFHFFSKSTWLTTFRESKLKVLSERKHTVFISIFTLIKNGDSL